MRAVVTRVREAQVTVEGQTVAAIGYGLLALVAARQDDTVADVQYMARKLVGLRVFPESPADDRYQCSVGDVAGQVLLVSQFTLYGDVRHGNRPGFTDAMAFDQAAVLLERLRVAIEAQGIPTRTGKFGATMLVSSMNDGPTTILIDSRRAF